MSSIQSFFHQSYHRTTLRAVCAGVFLCGIPIAVCADFWVTYPVTLHAHYVGVDVYDGNPVDELIEPEPIIVRASDIAAATTTWTITLTEPWTHDVPVERGVYALVRTADEDTDWHVEDGSGATQFVNYDFVHAAFSSTTPTTATIDFLIPRVGSLGVPSGTYRLIVAELPATKYVYDPLTDTGEDVPYTDADFVAYLADPYGLTTPTYPPEQERIIAFTYVADIASTTPPEITLVGDTLVLVEQGTIFADPGATAHDAEDGDITSSVVVSGSVDSSVLGTTTLTYTVTDSSGLTASVIRTVVVVPATVTTPTAYWAEIQSGEGALTLRTTPSLTGTELKQLPDGWAIWVASTTDSEGNDVEADGYLWYHVEDATDGTKGWMQAGPVDANHQLTKEYLSYNATRQTELEDKATKVYGTKEERAALIVEAVSHYYNNASTTAGLYSSNDMTNHFSGFKDGAFPSELITAIAKQESGAVDFDNSWVVFDYGHGIMQITTEASLGNGSQIRLPGCEDPNERTDCYGPSYMAIVPDKFYEDGSPFLWNKRDYAVPQQYYANSSQSIYANIKDGLRNLQEKYESAAVNAEAHGAYSLQDMRNISAVYRYNQGSPYKTQAVYLALRFSDNQVVWNWLDEHGWSLHQAQKIFSASWLNTVRNSCSGYTTLQFTECLEKLEVEKLSVSAFYLKNVAGNLPASQEDLRQKMIETNNSREVLWLASPGELRVEDVEGKTSGVVNGVIKEEVKNTVYDQKTGIISVLFPTQNERIRVTGTEDGKYDLFVSSLGSGQVVEMREVPTSPTEEHIFSIDWDVLAQGEKGVTIQIDHNGDGIPESTTHTGATLEDVAAPTTTPIVTGAEGANGWYTSIVSVVLNSEDGDGIGVKETQYSLDGSVWTTYASTSPIAVAAEGVHVFQFASVDYFGNREATSTLTIKIDTTSPEAMLAASTSTKDLEIIGLDNLSSTTVTKSGNVTTITDEAGNTTALTFQKTYSGNRLTYARLTHIQYGSSTPAALPSAFLYVWSPLTNPPTLVSQTVTADRMYVIEALYNRFTNKTTIATLKKGTKIQTKTVPGLATVKLTTNKSAIQYGW